MTTPVGERRPSNEIAHLKVDDLLERFEIKFPREMQILHIGGVYPHEQPTGQDPYTKEPQTEYMGNIGEHCMAVALCADALVQAYLGADHAEREDIVRRALVHDATKGFEVMRKKAVKSGLIADAYSPRAYDAIRSILEKQGESGETVDYMQRAGRETGHNSLPDFIELEGDQPRLIADNLPDMIIHLADDMTFTPLATADESTQTSFVTITERMELSDFPQRYPFLYQEGFGFDGSGKAVLVKDVHTVDPSLRCVRSYADWQRWVAEEMCKYLLRKDGQEVVADASTVVKKTINDILTRQYKPTA